eukprot:CAMPEP_0195290384 /NCGR_PEP_ID=MMETSP0707-20130614/6271_1 /TAXON_ID=33640 /ORGANISM="Asterionellopsis glacialis, Strain CCMP134" /LENGTH=233 /DNA_ID=CAMNT_0040350507 /DNA_START=156 /DNA_END=854 /DNA_ORIENTATION=+
MPNSAVAFFDQPVGLPLRIDGCWERKDPRPIWESSIWDKLGDAYAYSIGTKKKKKNNTLEEGGQRQSSFSVPFQVTQIPDKGRGIISTTTIRKGDLVWDANINTAFFTKKKDFHTFLSLLPYDLACDILQWAYVVYIEEPGHTDDDTRITATAKATLDLDPASYMNHSRYQANVKFCDDELLQSIHNNSCEMNSFKLYAARDILPGEEITVNYYSFDHTVDLDWFDELTNCAW